MSLDLALSNARTGLQLVNRQLGQVSDNIANAGTAGFTRKTIDSQSLVTEGQGFGVRRQEAQRSVDVALQARMGSTRSELAAAQLRADLLQGVEQAHGTVVDGNSVADLIGTLQADFVALQSSPADSAAQRAVVGDAQALAQRFHLVAGAIDDTRQQAQDGLVAEVAAANAALRGVAQLTAQIIAERVEGRSTATLEDKRDALIGQLSESLPVRAAFADNGDVTLVAAGGLVLPLDRDTDAFATAAAVTGSAAWHGAGGTLPGISLAGTDVTRQLSGGQLAGGRIGALLTLRDATLPGMTAELDTAAAQLAARLEAQGLRLFTGGDGATVPDTTLPYAGGGALGFAAAIQVNPAVLADPALVRDGTHDIAGSPAGATAFTANPAGGPASFGTLIQRVLAFGFGREIAKGVAQPGLPSTGLGPDGTLSSAIGGPWSIGDYASRLVAAQTATRADAAQAAQAAQDLLTTLQGVFNARSGVDTDTEMAALVTLQNAYAANARVVSVVQAMYDSLAAMVR
jgi:flagellar hook-associated protein 1 FlgK